MNYGQINHCKFFDLYQNQDYREIKMTIIIFKIYDCNVCHLSYLYNAYLFFIDFQKDPLLRQRWVDALQLPVGYFLIDGLDATPRSNVIGQCFAKLHNVNSNVMSLTFDGASSNIAMVKILGLNLDCSAQSFTTSFPHAITQAPVVVFLDPCHMLKLVRNTLADKKSMFDENNKIIKFEFI